MKRKLSFLKKVKGINSSIIFILFHPLNDTNDSAPSSINANLNFCRVPLKYSQSERNSSQRESFLFGTALYWTIFTPLGLFQKAVYFSDNFLLFSLIDFVHTLYCIILAKSRSSELSACSIYYVF